MIKDKSLGLLLIVFGVVIIMVSSFYLGALSVKQDSCKQYDGCWANVQAERSNEWNRWVCVNIKNMTPQKALEVCQHEVGHEIFAESCEKNMTKCFEVINATL